MLYTYNRKMPRAYTVKPFMQVLLWILFMLYVSASAMFVGDKFFGIIAEEDVVVMQIVALFFYVITASGAFHTLSEFYCSLFKGYKTIFGMQALKYRGLDILFTHEPKIFHEHDINIHGHLHTNTLELSEPYSLYYLISLENNGYTMTNLDALVRHKLQKMVYDFKNEQEKYLEGDTESKEV